MTIELKKKTTAVFARMYYYVSIDGEMVSDTWTTDPQKAEESYREILDLAKRNPEERNEVLQTITL